MRVVPLPFVMLPVMSVSPEPENMVFRVAVAALLRAKFVKERVFPETILLMIN